MLSPPRESAEAGRLFLLVTFLRPPSVDDVSPPRFLLRDAPERPLTMVSPLFLLFVLLLLLLLVVLMLLLDPDLLWEPEEDNDDDDDEDPARFLFPLFPRAPRM